MALSLAVLAQSAGSTPPPAPKWEAQPATDAVPFNVSLDVIVWGPPNATFDVEVSAPPIGSGPLLAAYAYHLTNKTNASGEASLTAAIPTGNLLMGAELLTALNSSFGTFLALRFTVLPPVNATTTQTSEQVSELWALYYAQVNHTIHEQGLYDQAHVYDQELVVLNVATCLFAVFLVWWRRPETNASERVRGLKEAGHSVLWEPAMVRAGYTSEEPAATLSPKPSHVWVGPKRLRGTCAGCRVPAGLSWRLEHMRRVHGVADPRPPRDFEQDLRALKGWMNEARVGRPRGASKPTTPKPVEQKTEGAS